MTPHRNPPTTPPERPGRPRVQDLAGAVLAGGDTEELLDLLVRSARTDLGARSSVLVMPLEKDVWVAEIVSGPDAGVLLGEQLPEGQEIFTALEQADADALEAIGTFDIGEETCRVLLAVTGDDPPEPEELVLDAVELTPRVRGVQGRLDVGPLGDVGGVDRGGPDAGASGRVHLVAQRCPRAPRGPGTPAGTPPPGRAPRPPIRSVPAPAPRPDRRQR